MLLILIPAVVALISLLILRIPVRNAMRLSRPDLNRVQKWLLRQDDRLVVTFLASVVSLCLIILTMGISHVSYITFPVECAAVQQTIDDARNRVMNLEKSPYEDAAILNTVISINRRLAIVKTYNDNLWIGWYIPDRVAKIPYIR